MPKLTTTLAADGLLPGATPYAPLILGVDEPPEPSRSFIRRGLSLILFRTTLFTDVSYYPPYSAEEYEQLPAPTLARFRRRWSALRADYDLPRLAGILDVLRWRLYGEARHEQPPTDDIFYEYLDRAPHGKWRLGNDQWSVINLTLELPLPRGPPPRLTSVADDILRYALPLRRESTVTLYFDEHQRFRRLNDQFKEFDGS